MGTENFCLGQHPLRQAKKFRVGCSHPRTGDGAELHLAGHWTRIFPIPIRLVFDHHITVSGLMPRKILIAAQVQLNLRAVGLAKAQQFRRSGNRLGEMKHLKNKAG